MAIYTSVILWSATIAGNVALFTVRPAHHWPALETLETLLSASLVRVVLYLHRLNRRATWSLPIIAIAVVAAVAGIWIDIGFVTGAVTYGQGLIGGPVFYAIELVFLVWLLAVNVLGWRLRSLPRRLAVLGIATAATATLLYPVWAIGLAHVDQTNAGQR